MQEERPLTFNFETKDLKNDVKPLFEIPTKTLNPKNPIHCDTSEGAEYGNYENVKDIDQKLDDLIKNKMGEDDIKIENFESLEKEIFDSKIGEMYMKKYMECLLQDGDKILLIQDMKFNLNGTCLYIIAKGDSRVYLCNIEKLRDAECKDIKEKVPSNYN